MDEKSGKKTSESQTPINSEAKLLTQSLIKHSESKQKTADFVVYENPNLSAKKYAEQLRIQITA